MCWRSLCYLIESGSTSPGLRDQPEISYRDSGPLQLPARQLPGFRRGRPRSRARPPAPHALQPGQPRVTAVVGARPAVVGARPTVAIVCWQATDEREQIVTSDAEFLLPMVQVAGRQQMALDRTGKCRCLTFNLKLLSWQAFIAHGPRTHH